MVIKLYHIICDGDLFWADNETTASEQNRRIPRVNAKQLLFN